MTINEALLDELARRFEWHSLNAYRGKTLQNASPLYSHLSLEVAKDRDVLALVMGADLAQQVSNLLFGAVHFLLLGGIQHPVSAFYRSLHVEPQPFQRAYPDFRDFCLQHGQEIRHLVTTRRVQTNEVGRAACLLPAFELVSQRANRRPLALVEIGASAGLHLRWDKYNYDYGAAGQIKLSTSSLTLTCETVGPSHPQIPRNSPGVLHRIGLDLSPIDVNDETSVRWLRALIWPEHVDRAEAFQKAVAIAKAHPVDILAGDAADLIVGAMVQAPADAALCVYHSYTLNQCPHETRERIFASLAELAKSRSFFRVSQEWYSEQEQPHLELFTYRDDKVQQELLAYCESHGRQIEWLLEQNA